MPTQILKKVAGVLVYHPCSEGAYKDISHFSMHNVLIFSWDIIIKLILSRHIKLLKRHKG